MARTIPGTGACIMKGGLRQDTTNMAGDGYIELENISRRYGDAFSNRPGLANRLNGGGRVMRGMVNSSGDEYLIYVSSDDVYKVDCSYDSTGATIDTGTVSSTVRGSFAYVDGRLYYADTTGIYVVLPDLTFATAGISPPTNGASVTFSVVAGSSSNKCSPGTHLIRYFYKDTDTGYYSAQSFAQEVEIDDDGNDYKIEFTYAASGGASTAILDSADSKVDSVIVEMTAANGSVFYEAVELTSGAGYGTKYIDDIDATIEQGDLTTKSNSSTSLSYVKLICGHRGRLFMIQQDVPGSVVGPQLLPSLPGLPENRDGDEARVIFDDANGDSPTAMTSAYGDIWIFGKQTAMRFYYTNEPTDGIIETMPDKIGAWNQQCICHAGGKVFGAGPDGVWQLSTAGPRIISDPVRTTIYDDVAGSLSTLHHMGYDARDQMLYYFYATSGDTAATKALCLDLRTGDWSKADFGRDIECSTTALDADGEPRLWISDGTWTGHLEYDVKDFVKSGEPDVLTVSSVASDVITVNETLTVDALIGARVYDPLNDQWETITDNDTSTITLDSAYGTTPTANQELYVGAYTITIQPKWMYDGEQARVSTRGERVAIVQIPDSTSGSTANFYLYKDFDLTSPHTWTAGAADYYPDGVNITDGNTYSTFDLDNAITHHPVTSSWSKFWTWKIEQIRPADFRLVNVIWNPDARNNAVVITDA